MIWAYRQLLTPMKYLRIRNGAGLFHSKFSYDFVIPALLTAFTCIIFGALDLRLEVYSHPKLTESFSNLLTLLIAFYMAALAAVSTFDRKGIDSRLKGDPAILRVRDNDGGHLVEKSLTYRQFISYLFGYLSFVSLCLFLLLLGLTHGWPKFENKMVHGHAALLIFKLLLDPILFVAVMFLFWQMVITSLLGIYFLTERLQSLTDPEN